MKEGIMNSIKKWRTGIAVVFGLLIFASMAQAQQTFQVMGCSSCKVVMLSEGKMLTIYSMTGNGPAWSETKSKTFNDMKWEFVATIRVHDGKTIGIGYYKFTDPDKDYFILEATGGAVIEGGPWNFVYGTGKWEGAKGTLRGRTTFRGRPLSTETEQYWCRIIGTLELPD
jgi:hypothetical protein